MTKQPIVLRGDDTRSHRDRSNAEWQRSREPERLAESALRTLNPDRAGRGPERSIIEPSFGASETERLSHALAFEKHATALFGIDVLTVAAKSGTRWCRWCLAGACARVGDRTTPHLLVGMKQPGERSRFQRAFTHLLGAPCPACESQLTADATRCDALRLGQHPKRRAPAAPPAASLAITAAALAGKTPAELQLAMDHISARVHGTRSTRRTTDRYGLVNPGFYAGKSLAEIARHR